MCGLHRQRAIRGADAAVREADRPPYAEVVAALHRLQAAVERMARNWGKTPTSDTVARAAPAALAHRRVAAMPIETPLPGASRKSAPSPSSGNRHASRHTSRHASRHTSRRTGNDSRR